MNDDQKEALIETVEDIKRYVVDGQYILGASSLDSVQSTMSSGYGQTDMAEVFSEDEYIQDMFDNQDETPENAYQCKFYVLNEYIGYNIDDYVSESVIDETNIPKRTKDESTEIKISRYFAGIGNAARIMMNAKQADNPSDIKNPAYIITYCGDEPDYPDDDNDRAEIYVEKDPEWKLEMIGDLLEGINDDLGQIEYLMEN